MGLHILLEQALQVSLCNLDLWLNRILIGVAATDRVSLTNGGVNVTMRKYLTCLYTTCLYSIFLYPICL